jgi:hypothetical protein
LYGQAVQSKQLQQHRQYQQCKALPNSLAGCYAGLPLLCAAAAAVLLLQHNVQAWVLWMTGGR